MLFEPTDPTSGTAARSALATIRVKCPSLADWSDANVLALAASLAHAAYGGAREEVWAYGRALALPDDDFQVVVREALVTLYPAAMLTGDAAARVN